MDSFDDVELLYLALQDERGDPVCSSPKDSPNCFYMQSRVMLPSAVTCGDPTAAGEERYATNVDYLLRPMWETFGEQAEVACMYDNGGFKWLGFRAISALPRGAMLVGRAHKLYEVHCRDTQSKVYSKGVLALSAKGAPLPVLWRGGVTTQADHMADKLSAVVAASIIEDARRANALTATVDEDVSVKFPVSCGAHKEFFALRDAPLDKAGRRKAILHWVRRHRRISGAQVSGHWRGAHTLGFDGLRVTLAAA